jgi:hypothetical protein
MSLEVELLVLQQLVLAAASNIPGTSAAKNVRSLKEKVGLRRSAGSLLIPDVTGTACWSKAPALKKTLEFRNS